MPIRVLVADDHPVFRQWLKAHLDRDGFRIVGEAADGLEAVQLARELQPDVALLDLGMPGLSGLEAVRLIVLASPSTKIILLTTHDETPYVVEALRAGAKGYIMKSQVADELIAAIRQVLSGLFYCSPPLCCRLLQALVRKLGPLGTL